VSGPNKCPSHKNFLSPLWIIVPNLVARVKRLECA